MDEIESLCRLCEAVETAGADIAPTYAEYVQPVSYTHLTLPTKLEV